MAYQSRSYYEGMLREPNVQRALASIRAAEGTAKKANPYAVGFGFSELSDLSQHPKQTMSRGFTDKKGRRNKSSAAGAYQFVDKTWSRVSKELGLTDFGPLSQDIAAVALIDGRKALDNVLEGDVKGFAKKVNGEWASFPGAQYDQATVSPKAIQKAWDSYDRMAPPGIGPVDLKTPTPTFTTPDARAIAAARGLLAPSTPPAVQTAGLLGAVPAAARPAPSVGLLASPASVAAPSPRVSAPVQMASVAPAVQTANVAPTVTPNQVAATAPKTTATITGMDVTPGMAEKGRRVTGPAIASGNISPEQEANLDARLGRSVATVAQSTPGLLGAATALSPSTAKPAGAVGAINGLLGSAPAVAGLSPVSASLSPVQNATAALAATPSVAKTLSPVDNAAKPASVYSSGVFDAAGLTPRAYDQAVAAAMTPAPNAPKYQAENPAAVAAPALSAPVNVPSRRVAATPAVAAPSMQAAQPAQTSIGTGIGAPDVPDAPGFGSQLAGLLGNSLSRNKGQLAGGLLGSMALGPVGGLLGGYIGNRIQQGNTPQMSHQARGAIEDGYFDGFAHGPVKNAGLFGGLGGLLGGMFGGGLGAPNMPGAPTGRANYSTGSGGPSMSSAAASAMDSGGFDGFSHSGSTQNNNTSKSSSSKSSSSKGSKSSGGKKK